MSSLKSLVDGPETQEGKIFAIGIQLLILVSLITFSISTLPDLSPQAHRTLGWIETITVVLFTIEYLLRVATADDKLKFIFSFFGLVDLLAISPFYLGARIDLRAIRSLRFLSLIRILKLGRYNTAVRRFHLAFLIAKEELVLFIVATLLTMFIAATGIYYFENTAQPEKFASVGFA